MANRKQQLEKIFASFQSIKRKMVLEFHSKADNHITGTQVQVLFMVKNNEGIGIKEISEKMGISPSAVTQLVEALVANEMLSRESSPKDGRVVILKLTEESRKHMLAMRAHGLEKLAALFEALNDAELEQLGSLFAKIEQKILSEKNEKR